ncbi:MAG: hypothetical protein EOM14_12895 [Clostridia bacterium]|nr:hypothetical protein [Clostridia bacterium]
MSTTSWDDIGTASADLLEQSMTAKVKETASGFVDRAGELGENVNKRFEWMEMITSVVTFSDMLADAQTYDRQKWQDIAAGAEAKRLLNDFYEALQDGIENYKQKSDKAGWSIDFSQAVSDERVFTFFGVSGNYQYWYLDMLMSQKSTNEYGSVAGEYEGHFTIRAKNLMEGFQSNAGEAIKHMGAFGDGIQKFLNKNPESKLTTASAGSASVYRTISGSCQATVDESGNINLSLQQEQDETSVNISGMAAELKISYDTSGTIKNEGTMPLQISADEEEITVSGVTYKISGKSELTPGQSFDFSTTLGGGSVKTGWDDNIWKPWNGTQKTLKFAGG